MRLTESYIKDHIIRPIVERCLAESEQAIDEMDSAGVGDFSYDAPAFTDKATSDHSNMFRKGIPSKKLTEDEDGNKVKNSGLVHSVMNALRSEMVNMATIARDLIKSSWTDIDEDTARSKLSKISRGILPITDNEATIIVHSLRDSGFKI